MGGNYAKLTSSGSIECSNEVFGDPLVGTGKECVCLDDYNEGLGKWIVNYYNDVTGDEKEGQIYFEKYDQRLEDAQGTFDGSYEYECCRDSGSETDKSYSPGKTNNLRWFVKSDTTRYLYDSEYALSIWNFNATIGIWVANYSEHANLFETGD